MKKIVLIGVVVVVIAIVVLVRLNGAKDATVETAGNENLTTKTTKYTKTGADEESSESAQFVDNLTYSEEKLSAPVKALLGLDGEKQNYNSMGRAIRELSKDLGADDLAALREMLTWPNDMFPEGMRPIEINAIKNDILDRLLRQTVLPKGIGLQLVEMASNPENDPVWRDYCVQFMTPFYERAANEKSITTEGTEEHGGVASSNNSESSSAAGGGNEVDELGAIREAMVSALDERGSTIAGTSLIGLELLSRTHDEFDREAIVDSAVDIAADESASAASRMTALRLSAGLTTEGAEGLGGIGSESSVSSSEAGGEINSEVAETARLLAQTGETVLLRSAAIVTLGEVGSDADRELLESFTQDGDRQIAEAAKLALEKMDAPKKPVVDLAKPEVAGESNTSPQPVEKLPPILIN